MVTVIRGTRTREERDAARAAREGGVLSGFSQRREDRLASGETERFERTDRRRGRNGEIPIDEGPAPLPAGNGTPTPLPAGTSTAPSPSPAPASAPNAPAFGPTDPFERLNLNLQSGSPYIDLSRSKALEFANSRGLANSTIAGEAGVRAAIEAASPFALQGAAQANEREAQEEAFGQQLKLQERDITAQRELSEINVAAQARIAELDATTRSNIATLDANTQTAVTSMNIQNDQQARAISAAASFSSTQAQMYSAIMSNPNISAEDRAAFLADIGNMTSANLGLIEQLYNIDLSWGSDTLGTTAPATPPTGGVLPTAPTAPAAAATQSAPVPAFNPADVPTAVSGAGLNAKFPQPSDPTRKIYVGGTAYLTQLKGMERRDEVPEGTSATVEAAFRAAGYIR
jgi:hypothetical protein